MCDLELRRTPHPVLPYSHYYWVGGPPNLEPLSLGPWVYSVATLDWEVTRIIKGMNKAWGLGLQGWDSVATYKRTCNPTYRCGQFASASGPHSSPDRPPRSPLPPHLKTCYLPMTPQASPILGGVSRAISLAVGILMNLCPN